MGKCISKSSSGGKKRNAGNVAKPVVNIKVVSDFTSPLCWVCKKLLDAAMQELGNDYTFTVTWEPFILCKTQETGDINIGEIRDSGSIGREIINKGKSLGLFTRPLVPGCPDTTNAHLLMIYALQTGGWEKQHETADKIFQSVFEKGSTLVEQTLLAIADEVFGTEFDRQELQALLEETNESLMTPDNLERRRELSNRHMYWLGGFRYKPEDNIGHGHYGLPFYERNDTNRNVEMILAHLNDFTKMIQDICQDRRSSI